MGYRVGVLEIVVLPLLIILLWFIYKVVSESGWHPRKKTTYKSWEMPNHFRYKKRAFVVKVMVDCVGYDGSFSVNGRWCEIQTPKVNMILPVKNVRFKRKIRVEVSEGGQSKVNTYTAKVKTYSEKDVKRFTQWKKWG